MAVLSDTFGHFVNICLKQFVSQRRNWIKLIEIQSHPTDY